MAKHRKLVLWMLIPLGVVGIAIARWCSNREPVFEGKPISYWLDSAQKGFPGASTPGQPQPSPNPIFKAKQAVAAIGPKALPYIAARAGSETPPPWNRFYSRIYGYIPSTLSRYLPKPSPKRGLGLLLTSGYFLAVTERAGTNATPVLVSLYSSQNADVRRAAILSLGRLAPMDHLTTLPVFQRALRDSNMVVRFDTFRQLCQMAGTDRRVGTILATYLNDAGTNAPDWMRLEGMAASGANTARNSPGNDGQPLVSATNPWEQAFSTMAEWQRSPTSEGRQRVLASFEIAFATNPERSPMSVTRSLENLHLTAQQEKEMLVPLLVKGLCASNSTVRMESATMLRNLRPLARSAAPLVLQAFDKSPSREFFLLLADLGPQAAAAVSALVHELKSAPDDISIWEITYALGKVGPGAKGAVPTLLTMARENSGEARPYMLSALAQIEPQNPETVPFLLVALKAEDSRSRAWAARILGAMGAWASNAVPALKQVLLQDEWLEPKLDAATALFRIDEKQGSELVPVLVEAIAWPEADGYPTPAIVARLLGQAGHAATPAVPALLKLLNHEDERARIAAAEALVKIDSTRKSECVAVLRDVMTHSRYSLMRFYGAKALLHMAPESSASVVAEIASLLKPSVQFYQQEEAIRFLAEIGLPARTALPQLREALESRDWKPRRAARDAIERIQTGAASKTSPL